MGNYLEQEEVINNSYISVDGFRKLIPICETRARAEFKKIVDEMSLNKEFYFDTRPRLIPTKKVIEKFDIDVNLIRREAEKMKRGMNKWQFYLN